MKNDIPTETYLSPRCIVLLVQKNMLLQSLDQFESLPLICWTNSMGAMNIIESVRIEFTDGIGVKVKFFPTINIYHFTFTTLEMWNAYVNNDSGFATNFINILILCTHLIRESWPLNTAESNSMQRNTKANSKKQTFSRYISFFFFSISEGVARSRILSIVMSIVIRVGRKIGHSVVRISYSNNRGTLVRQVCHWIRQPSAMISRGFAKQHYLQHVWRKKKGTIAAKQEPISTCIHCKIEKKLFHESKFSNTAKKKEAPISNLSTCPKYRGKNEHVIT